MGLASAVAFLGAFAGLAVVGVNPAGASTVDAVATIVNPDGFATLTSGGSTTQFTLSLPASAACDGDTATGGYHVFSYLVPQGTDPTQESFVNGFPSVDYGLVDANGNYFGKVNTAQTTGQVINIPTNLEFGPLLSKGVTAATLESNDGVWETGVACANSSGTVTDYWNTQVTFTANGGDPNGFVWSDTPGGPPSIPAAPTATAGPSSATVNWTAPAGNGGSAVTGYVLTPYIGASAQTPINLGSVTTDDVTGLTPDTAYTFTVAAINAIGTGVASAASNSITPTTVPDAPAAPTATAGNTQASVSWSAPFDEGSSITGYVITPYVGASAQTPIDVGNVTSYVVTGLTNGTAYTFTVAATNSVGTGDASPASNSVTPVTVPDQPAAPTATAGNASTTVNWSAPSNEGDPITGYVLTPYIGASAQTPISLGNVTSDNVTGLTNGTAYTFTVAATNSVGTGIASNPSNSVTPATVAGAPTIGTATAGNASATVNWTAPSDNGGGTITGYVITPYIGATAQTPVNVGNVTTYNVTGLANGTAYTFTVAATNSAGTGSASSASNSVTPVTVPGAPTIGAATAGNASATVNWTAPSDNGGAPVSGYVITPYIGGTAQTPVNVGTITADTVTGLTNGTAYTFTVAATNTAGTGSASSASNSVTPVTIPSAPTIGTATAGKGTATVKWTVPSSNGGSAITGYVVTPYIGATAKTPVHVGNVTSDAVTGLANGTAYTFTVAATNAAGTGSASSHSKSVTPNGLYVVTKTLPKATKGKKYTAVHLTEKNGVGTETWKATGLPKGLTLTTAGVLSGTVTKTDAAKTYSVTITVTDSSKPKKQTATVKFSLVVAS